MLSYCLRSFRPILLLSFGIVAAQAETFLKIEPDNPRQEFQGMGCGAIFYEAHITSLAATRKHQEQAALYDAMFRDAHTDFLQLMIRHDHEPENDNSDPQDPAFDLKHFAYTDHTIAICKAARERNPKIRFHATLYTPPVWMKTNGAVDGGGKARATIKPGTELELAEYCWAFLSLMQRAGYAVEFLSIANEPDWPHDQPGYFLTPESHAALIAKVSTYLDVMAKRHPEVPRAKLVGPNTLSAVDAAARWIPKADKVAPGAIAVVGSHDYDRRGDRIATLRKAAGERPVWITEWCVNGKDSSPDLLNSAGEYWLAMTEAFNQGANAWMTYDWVYPPRDGGEALIHVEWGNRFHKTRIYHGFRQWCSVLVPGMRVVKCEVSGDYATGVSKPGVKATAFLSADGKRLVAHVANVQNHDASLRIDPGPAFSKVTAKQWRTSGSEDCTAMEPVPAGTSSLPVPKRSLNTWEWIRP